MRNFLFRCFEYKGNCCKFRCVEQLIERWFCYVSVIKYIRMSVFSESGFIFGIIEMNRFQMIKISKRKAFFPHINPVFSVPQSTRKSMAGIKAKPNLISLLTQIPHLNKFFQCRADRPWFSGIVFQQYFSVSLPSAKYLIKHVDHDLITDYWVMLVQLFVKMNENTHGS